MNKRLKLLRPYPFERLRLLLAGVSPADLAPIRLSIGEPQHPPPPAALRSISRHMETFSRYPAPRGELALRETCLEWLCRRFDLRQASLDPERHILPLNGSREGLFSIGQCLIDATETPLAIMSNPLYQIYEGAALLGGAETYYLNCLDSNDFIPEFDELPKALWQRCQLLYLCTPDNPSGAVLPQATLQSLIEYAHRFDFNIVCDECYCEIYHDETAPPQGLLAAAQAMGNVDYSRCLAFYSLSKRSNLPGLRSGFVAGDEKLLEQFLTYRTYHGCSMPLPVQQASIAAWRDEKHVVENRRLYGQKIKRFIEIVGDKMQLWMPEAGFYLWPDVGADSERFTRSLYEQQNVEILPGKYLARESGGINPGANRVRIALVAPFESCETAARRIRDFLHHFQRIEDARPHPHY